MLALKSQGYFNDYSPTFICRKYITRVSYLLQHDHVSTPQLIAANIFVDTHVDDTFRARQGDTPLYMNVS